MFQFAVSRGDVSLVGDFNSHFDDDSDPQVAKLKTMLGDNNLTQLVNVSTHKHGHILDWVVVRSDGNRMSFDGVIDYPDLSDHKVVVCSLATACPQASKRLVTSRNIRAISASAVQSDVRTMVESASLERCPDLNPVSGGPLQ